MKHFNKFQYILISIILLSLFTACQENPTYAVYDDRAALIDIVSRDYPTLFETELIDTDIPDTTAFLKINDFVLLHQWRESIRSGRKYLVNAIYPDSVYAGNFPEATVTITDTLQIKYNVMATDTSANPDTLVRYSTESNELITVIGRMEKWGDQYDYRNGWILQESSGTGGGSLLPQSAIESVILSGSGLGENTYSYDNLFRLKSLNDIDIVGLNETITVSCNVANPNYIVTFHIGRDTFTKVIPQNTDDNLFEAELNAPGEEGYFHITIDVISHESLESEDNYQFRRLSIPLYAAEW
ncbi:MAG: hypothetical protein GY855_12495 [candidate division Zixibacteria bacterium]|nr:hypothetical protein [candidate division Zixibacteria bacterium]